MIATIIKHFSIKGNKSSKQTCITFCQRLQTITYLVVYSNRDPQRRVAALALVLLQQHPFSTQRGFMHKKWNSLDVLISHKLLSYFFTKVPFAGIWITFFGEWFWQPPEENKVKLFKFSCFKCFETAFIFVKMTNSMNEQSTWIF